MNKANTNRLLNDYCFRNHFDDSPGSVMGRGSFCGSDVEQHGHQRDGKDGKQGGNEGQLGDERGVPPHLQAEDGAVGGHGHGDDHGVDVHRQLQSQC